MNFQENNFLERGKYTHYETIRYRKRVQVHLGLFSITIFQVLSQIDWRWFEILWIEERTSDTEYKFILREKKSSAEEPNKNCNSVLCTYLLVVIFQKIRKQYCSKILNWKCGRNGVFLSQTWSTREIYLYCFFCKYLESSCHLIIALYL